MNYQNLNEASKSLSILLKGLPGTGKTFKAAQFPSPVIFNFDNNLRGLKKLPKEITQKLKIINPYVNEKGDKIPARKVYDSFATQLTKVGADSSIKTIIIDSLTTLQDVLIDKVLNSPDPTKNISQNDRGTIKNYWKNLGRVLLENDTKDKHIIIIAHENAMQVDDTIVYGLNLEGGMRNGFDVYFTDVWRTYLDSSKGRNRFMVATTANPKFSAKCSLDLPEFFEWDAQKDKVLEQL